MGKNAGPFRLAAEYYAARMLVGGMSVLPLGAASWLGARMGDLLRLVDKRHRRRVYDQVSDRLGLAGEELDRFVKANFRSYGKTLGEFARLSRMRREDFAQYVDIEPFKKRLEELRAEGKGVIFITAHFGNWEWNNSLASSLGVSGGSIARPLDNPRVNELVRSVRERNGLRIFDKAGAIRKALGALKDNNLVGILIDQDAGHNGLMSPFLGKPASTLTVPVELSIRTGSPMVVVGLRRGGSDKRFTLLFNPRPHRPNPDADTEQETCRLTDALNEDLGNMIMQAPEQWFWIHRRWKSEGLKYGRNKTAGDATAS